MYLLKLFRDADPAQPIAAHLLSEGQTRVGRDPAVDWVIDDPDCEVSRTHLELICSGGALAVRPLGTNGVFAAGGGQLAHGETAPLGLGDAISFGKFRMLVDAAPKGDDAAVGANRTILSAAPFGTNLDIPAAWPDATALPIADGEESLLEAFCRGADLDVSAFSNEDPAEVMARAGAIYRQMVLGLSDLMAARSTIKEDHRLERTTIGAIDNNPFKWAPSRRLASDLLLRQDAGFLPGPEAIRFSFGDVKRHMIGTLAGFRAAILAVVTLSRPARIEAEIANQKSLLQSQAAASWAAFGKLHAEFERECQEGADGPIGAAFASAYQAQLDRTDKSAS